MYIGFIFIIGFRIKLYIRVVYMKRTTPNIVPATPVPTPIIPTMYALSAARAELSETLELTPQFVL